jgi:hypothetical protein
MCPAMLVVAGLGGAVSFFLLPVFVVKAAQRKQRERVIQVTLLAACAIVQGAIGRRKRADALRHIGADVLLFADVVWKWRNDATYCLHIPPALRCIWLGATRNEIHCLNTRTQIDTPVSVP